MFKFSKKIEYSLIILKYMDAKDDNELSSAREICEHFFLPFDTTSKIMQTLATHGILRSTQGIKGGYQLIKNLNDISFHSLTKLIEKESSNLGCLSAHKKCDQITTCNIITPMQQLIFRLNDYMEQISLKDIFSYQRAP